MATRFISHLDTELPAGWLPSEALVATRADGTASLLVSCQPAFGEQLDDLAARHGAALAARFSDYGELSLLAAKTAQGHRALLRRARAGTDAHVALYAVTGPWSYVGHATGPADESEELVRLLGALRPVGLAGGEPVTPFGEAAASAPPPTGVSFTTEELVAVAETFATPSLLGYDRRIFGREARDVADAMVATARRSLRTRGVLAAGSDGQPVVSEAYQSTLGLALRHDQWIQATVQSATSLVQVSWAVRADDAVALTSGAYGTAHLEAFSASDLAERITAFTGIDDDLAAGESMVSVAAGAVPAAVAGTDDDGVAAVIELVGPAPRVVRLRSLTRSGGVVHGDEASWLVGPKACRLVEAGAPAGTLTLRPADTPMISRSLTSAAPPKEPSA